MPPGSVVGGPKGAWLGPQPGHAYVYNPPSTDLLTDFSDRFGSGSHGAKLSAWMKQIPKRDIMGPLVKRAGWYGLGFDAMRYYGDQFSEALPWQDFLAMIPYGHLNVWGWTVSCKVAMNCDGVVGGINSGPHGKGWSDQLKVCTDLCSIPTAQVTDASLNSQPYLWSGNGDRKIGYGYWCDSFGANSYMRAKLVIQAPVGTPADRFYTATRLKRNPGLLPDPFAPSGARAVNILPDLAPVAGHAIPEALPYRWKRPAWLPGVDPAYQALKEPLPKAASPVVKPVPGTVVGGIGSPNLTAIIEPGLSVPSKARPGRHRWVPHWRSGGRRREVGGKAQGTPRTAFAIFGAVTEGLDVVDALWNAMGQAGGWQTKIAGEQTSPQQKLQDLWDAFHDDKHFNQGTFWFNVPSEIGKKLAADLLVAVPGQFGKAASRTGWAHGGAPMGYGSGGALTKGPGTVADNRQQAYSYWDSLNSALGSGEFRHQ